MASNKTCPQSHGTSHNSAYVHRRLRRRLGLRGAATRRSATSAPRPLRPRGRVTYEPYVMRNASNIVEASEIRIGVRKSCLFSLSPITTSRTLPTERHSSRSTREGGVTWSLLRACNSEPAIRFEEAFISAWVLVYALSDFASRFLLVQARTIVRNTVYHR